jgi:2-oxoglutarate dehydrogenase E1 component
MQIQHASWQVVNCTTPANYFHCLRRQIHRDFRKPLIVVAPRTCSVTSVASSNLEDMGPGTEFNRVMEEQDREIVDKADEVKTLVFCTGQIYYELLTEREKRGVTDVALVRLEQIAPFAFDRVAEEAALYKNADIVWAQQEPKNMGAWEYFNPRAMTATRKLNSKECARFGVVRQRGAATGMAKVT